MMMKEEEIDRFYKALRDTNLGVMETLLKEQIAAKVPPTVILNEGLIGAMAVIGQEFKACQVWVPEVLLAARNMNRGIEILRPELSKGKVEPKGKIIIGTVKGDIHDIGKNLVTMLMTGLLLTLALLALFAFGCAGSSKETKEPMMRCPKCAGFFSTKQGAEDFERMRGL